MKYEENGTATTPEMSSPPLREYDNSISRSQIGPREGLTTFRKMSSGESPSLAGVHCELTPTGTTASLAVLVSIE